MSPPVNAAMLAEIRRLFLRCHRGDTAIGREFGMTREQVREIRRKHGIVGGPRPHTAVSEEDVARVADLAAQGYSARWIGQQIGRTKGSVLHICERNKIKLSGTRGAIGGNMWSPGRRATFERMRADPELWARYCGKVGGGAGGTMDVIPRPAAPGAWEAALAGRRFENVPLVTRLHERGGAMPSRAATSTGLACSSMAYE